MIASSPPASPHCGMLNQVLDETDDPDAARHCGTRNSSDHRRAHGQHKGESRQPPASHYLGDGFGLL